MNPLALRDFRTFILCRFLSAFSQRMIMVALGWFIYDLTNDPLGLAFVGLALFLPAVVLFLPAGYFADRFERKHVLAASYALMGASAALLTAMILQGQWPVWSYYLVLALLGSANAFGRPSNQSYIPQLVPRDILPNALAWGSTANKGATIVGPMVGGYLYYFGPTVVFSTGVVLYAVAFMLVLTVHPLERPRPAHSEMAALGWRGLFAGLVYIRGWPIVLGAITLDLFAMILAGTTALLPIFARDILHTGPEGLGMLRSAPAIGAGVTAIMLAQIPLRRNAGNLMYAGIVIYGLFTIIFGLSESLPLSIVCLIVMGAADMVSTNIRSTMIQLATPDEMRGRVSAVNALSAGASNELGDFEAGVAAALVGPVAAVVIGGIGSLAVVAIWMAAFPQLRRIDRPAEIKPAAGAG